MGKVSDMGHDPTWPTQPSIPRGSVNEQRSIYLRGSRGWRTLNSRLELCMAVSCRSGPVGVGPAMAYRLYARSVSDNSVLEMIS